MSKHFKGFRAVLAGSISALALLVVQAHAETLTIWGGSPEMVPFYEHVAEGLRQKHPDLEVSVEAITLREHEKRVAFALPSGTGPDIVEMQADGYRFLEAGLVAPAPEAIAGLVNDAAQFDPVFRNAASVGDTVYGVPLYRGQSALYYNLDMFAAAGLDAPPQTIEQFSEYAEKLTQRDANGNPTVSGWSLRLSGGGQGIAEKFWINLHQFGGSLISSKDGKWYADFANETGRLALKQYLSNLYTLKTVTPEMKADAEAFELGQTAMFIRESWVIGDIAAKAPGLNYAAAPMPKGSLVIPASLFVPFANERSELAWEFVQASVEPGNLKWMLDNVGWLPSRSGLDLASSIAAKPALAAFLEVPADYTYFTLPAVPTTSEILTRFAARLTNAFADPALATDDAAIDRVLKEAADEVNSILDRDGLLLK